MIEVLYLDKAGHKILEVYTSDSDVKMPEFEDFVHGPGYYLMELEGESYNIVGFLGVPKERTMYSIAILPFFYEPDFQAHNSVSFVFEEEDRSNIRYFETKEEAQEWLQNMLSTFSPWRLSYGEYAVPEFVIVPFYVAEYIFSGRNGPESYDWEGCPCTEGDDGTPCGECYECIAHMIGQDRDYIEEHKVI